MHNPLLPPGMGWGFHHPSSYQFQMLVTESYYGTQTHIFPHPPVSLPFAVSSYLHSQAIEMESMTSPHYVTIMTTAPQFSHAIPVSQPYYHQFYNGFRPHGVQQPHPQLVTYIDP